MNTNYLQEKPNKFPKHGGQSHLLKQHASKAKSWIDFSASINPLGPSPKIEEAIQNSIEIISRYPDPDSTKLRQALSEYIGVDASQLIVTNGSTELIYLLPHLLKNKQKALIFTPIFSEYQRAFGISKIDVQTISYDVDKNFEPQANKLYEILRDDTQIGAVVIGHPNSPTGRLWNENELSTVVKLCESREILLVIDETFIDFCPDGSSAIEKYKNHKDIILIRSMTKFFALPGIRLGFGIMSSKLAEKLKSFQYPWSVNGLAQEFGLASLQDKSFVQKSKRYVLQQREAIYKQLKIITNLRVFPSDANFLLFKLRNFEEIYSHRFQSQLIKDGIILRNCENFEGLDSTYFRLGIRREDENKLLLSKLKTYYSPRNDN